MIIKVKPQDIKTGDIHGGREVIRVDKGNPKSSVTIIGFSSNPRDCLPLNNSSEVQVYRTEKPKKDEKDK